jgi:hypothetical protein
MNKTILDVPADIYARAEAIAQETNRSVEAVLIDGLALLFGTRSDTIDPEELQNFSDERLWAVVYHHLAWPQDARLRALVDLGRRGLLSDDERSEMERLIALVDRLTLLRSHALVILKQRGHDVETKLRLGA